MTSTEAYLALNMLPNIGPVRVRTLLEVFGEPQAILEANASQLTRIHNIGPEVANSITRWRELADLDGELKRVEKAGAHVLTQQDAAYPKQLREIASPPLVLYVKGKLDERDNRSIGIVGSRRTTMYGRDTAQKLAIQLAHCGMTIVSGGARGIDTAAHEGALKIQGRTIAVLGSGLDVIYPSENKALFEQIAASGAVISEFPFGTEPDKQTFPMRNRIVSGMSLGVLVVEAGLTSGALITVNFAMEQGRQVFAVPGRIDSPLSKGTHRLIKEGAKLVEDAEDVLEEFEYLFSKKARTSSTAAANTIAAPQLNENESKVYAQIDNDEVSIDELIRGSGLTSAVVSATLLALEMKKLVRQLPGKRFARMFPVE
ncbi:MAG: DNA-protecting protein DprA [Verrucomicrobiae bacterium]|nr:DNA-protecting protein DprA [Verrucomicrobiae bacterium]